MQQTESRKISKREIKTNYSFPTVLKCKMIGMANEQLQMWLFLQTWKGKD